MPLTTLRSRLPLLPVLLCLCALIPAVGRSDSEQLDLLQLPPGFSIAVVSAAVPGARQMALADNGVLFVGSMRPGAVYALHDPDGDGIYGKPLMVAEKLTLPSGVAVRGDDLYIGAVGELYRLPGAASQAAEALAKGTTPAFARELVTDALPDKRHHGWKYLRFAPNGQLMVPVGAPCNICDEPAPFASILALDPADGSWQPWANGVRNSVGLAFHPDTGELWFSDNGRDMLGDDIPADEINRVARQGQHFGYPYFHAGIDGKRELPDPEFAGNHNADAFVAPALAVQAHSAVLGISFHSGNHFPAGYQHRLFIAEHGSWNRSSKVGYQVSMATLDPSGTRVLHHQPFITGWLQGEDNWGRPNDVLEDQDGSLLISDDQQGVLYRVRYQPTP